MRDRVERLLARLGFTHGTLSRKVLNSGAWVALASVVINLITFAKTIVLARLLTPEIFGLMTICLMLIKILEALTQTGSNVALIQRQHGFDEAKDTVFTLLAARGLLLTAIFILIAPQIARFYERPELEFLLQVVAISFLFGGFKNINTLAHEKELDFRRLMYLEQLVALLNAILVIAIAYYYRSVWALVIGHVATTVIGMILSYVLVPGRPRFYFDRKIALELFQYGKFITGLSILLLIASEIDNALIGKVLGVEALGFYFIAFMLANLPTTHITKIAARVIFPAYSKLQNDPAALNAAYLRVLGLISHIAIPAAAGLMFLAYEIIDVVYGEKWLSAVAPLMILSIFGGARAIAALNGYLFNAIGKPDVSFYITAVRLFVIVVMIYPMTVSFGLVGAALSVTIPMLIQLILSMSALKSAIGLDLVKIAKEIGICAFQSLLMVLVIYAARKFLQPVGALDLALLVLLGAAFYFGVSYKRIIFYLRGRPKPA